MSESEAVKVHKMKVVIGEKYHCGDSGCDGHIPATLVCSCGYTKEFKDPNRNRIINLAYSHKLEVIKAAGIVFELVE